jgi:hypothetical protein
MSPQTPSEETLCNVVCNAGHRKHGGKDYHPKSYAADDRGEQ